MNRRNVSLHLTAAMMLLTACGGPASDSTTGAEHSITPATIDSLPVMSVADGGLVCRADGRTMCPLHTAVANWLTPSTFALYEPGRQIAVWRTGDTTGVAIGGVGLDQVGMYSNPSGVGAGANGEVLVADMSSNSLLHYSSDGNFVRAEALPRLFGRAYWTFAGALPLLQRIAASDSASPAIVELRVLKAAGDSTGRVALTQTIPWLHLQDAEISAPLPMFAIQPLYAFAADGALTWSSAEAIWIRRLNPAGGTAWTLTSTISGPPVTSAELAARRLELQSAGNPAIDLDAMQRLAPSSHAAVASLTLSLDGRVAVGLGHGLTGDSTSYLLLSAAGVPTARFALGKRTTPLLFTGDSLLVHRPTEAEPWEVRWLKLSKVP